MKILVWDLISIFNGRETTFIEKTINDNVVVHTKLKAPDPI